MKAVGRICGKQFELQSDIVGADSAAIASSELTEVDLWHRQLANVNSQLLLACIMKDNLVSCVKVVKPGELSFCEGCLQGKMARKPGYQEVAAGPQ